jgi:hypothetical protein
MLGALRTIADRLLGRGAAALTVPPLDGALRPNNRLDDAPPGIDAAAPDCLTLKGGKMVWAEGARLMGPDGALESVAGDITALAASPGGAFAMAIDGAGVTIDGKSVPALARLTCITALAFEDDNTLWIAIGSTENPIGQWSRDLLERRRTGCILRYDLKAAKLMTAADRLAYPNGMLWTGNGMIVSEAWAKQLLLLGHDGSGRPVISDLPGYPAGLAHSGSGGFWLALFAPRSPLIELVLREPAYRKAMMQEVDPAYWIAPALHSGGSFLEPMQGGALKQMGILKPWAPTRSYGLAVELSDGFTPIQSLHSRAGGKRHGVTSVLERNGELWLTSKGGGEIVRVDLDQGDRP